MTDGITIREAQAGDEAAVRAVHGRAFSALRTIYRPGPQARPAETCPVLRLVAVEGGEIRATACYDIQEQHLEIWGFATDPAQQRRGLARALLHRMEVIARAQGLGRIRARVVTETGNVAIYQRLGFHVVATAPSSIYISDRFPIIHETVMEKLLRSNDGSLAKGDP